MTKAPAPLPVQVVPEPGSRLDQLCAELGSLEPEAERMVERLETLKNAIKGELARLLPEGDTAAKAILRSPYLPEPRQLAASTRWIFDAKKCKAENPLIYATYAKQSTSWALRKVS